MTATTRCVSLSLIASLGLASLVSAQTTWIVDAAGGAGVHFTDIPPAVAIAQNGDTILVRGAATSYEPSPIYRGVRVVGQAKGLLLPTIGAGSPGGLRVEGLPAGQTCVIAGLSFASGAVLSVLNSAGHVVLDSLGTATAGVRLTVNGSTSVALRICALQAQAAPALLVNSASVTASRCTIRGLDGFPTAAAPGAGAFVLQGRLELSESLLIGGRSFGAGAPQPALQLGLGARATVAVGCSLYAGGTVAVASFPSYPSSLTLDPRALVSGTIDPPIVVTSRPTAVQSVERSGATALRIELAGASPGQLAGTWLGAPGAPLDSTLGTLWLDPASLIPLLAAVVDPSGRTSVTLDVPSWPQLLGVAFGAQSATFDAAAQTIALSTAALAVVR